MMIRKSTLHNLTGALLIAAIFTVLFGGMMALGFLLRVERLLDRLPDVVGVVIVALWGMSLVLLVVFGLFAYILWWASHRSWRVNRARYPALKAAIERYREPGEGVRRVLPAFVVDGRRYFLVKYGRKYREWEPGKPETGMLVLDEHGRVQNDETLFRSLLRATRYVEESYLHDSLVAHENFMAVGSQAARHAAEFRAFFSRVLRSAGQPELMHDIDAFLATMVEQVQRLAGLIETDYHWCQKNRNRAEFTLEEMKPLWKVLEETVAWDMEAGRRVGNAWAKVEELRPKLESLPGVTSNERARMRKLLDALRVTAKSAADTETFAKQVAPERIEAYRSRTAKALRLEGQGQAHASVQ